MENKDSLYNRHLDEITDNTYATQYYELGYEVGGLETAAGKCREVTLSEMEDLLEWLSSDAPPEVYEKWSMNRMTNFEVIELYYKQKENGNK